MLHSFDLADRFIANILAIAVWPVDEISDVAIPTAGLSFGNLFA